MTTNKLMKAISLILTSGILLQAFVLPATAASDNAKTAESTSVASKTAKNTTAASPYDYVEPQYENASYMTDQQYKDLGFSSLNDPKEFSESDKSNPLEGYTPSILSELYMGRGGYGKDYTADAKIFENAKSYNDLNINTLGNNTLAKNDSYINDANNGKKWQYQSSTTAAIKLGDLSSKEYIPDSVIQNSMYVKDGKSYQSIVLYKYNAQNHTLDYVWNDEWKLHDNKFVQDIELQESGGYQAITVGDFDNDNYNEVAFYRSSKDNPEIAVYKQKKDQNGNITLEFKLKLALKDLSSHYSKTKDTNRPLVSLSTTNISGKDDLVVSVSLPYSNDDSFKHDGCTAIYSLSGDSPKVVFQDNGVDNKGNRMIFTNSVTMDVNGDGSNELVVASNLNYNYKNGDSRGDMSKNENLVNIILWDSENQKYYKAWDYPAKIEALDWVKKDKDRKEPVAITASRFNIADQKETLFVEGIFYSFAPGAGTTAEEQIKGGKFVASKKFSNSTGSHNPFFHTAVSACFVEDNRTSEQALVVYGDESSSDTDKIYLDIYWCYSDGTNIKTQCSNDNYFSHKDEDDNGTFLTFCPLDIDNDSVYMQYTNKTVGWSNPQVHSVMLSTPYWNELDYGSTMSARGQTSYSITTGTGSTYSQSDTVTLGYSLAASATVSFLGNGGTGGVSLDTTAQYLYNYQHAHTKSETLTFSSGGGDDYAAVLIVPIVTYHYKTWVPKHTATEDEVNAYLENYGSNGCPKVGDTVEGYFTDTCVNIQLNPANSTIPVDTYNRVIENYNKTEENEEYRLPTINLDEIYAGRIKGDPSTYAKNINEISSLDPEAESTLQATNDCNISINGKSTVSQALSTGSSKSSSNGFGFSIKLGYSANIKIGFDIAVVTATLDLKGGISAGYNGTFTWATSKSDNISYTNTYASLPSSAQTGTADGVPTSAYAFSARLVKWEPECGTTAEIETLSGDTLKTNMSVIGSTVTGADGAPPALPSNFYVSSTTKDTATLRWSNSTNYKRTPKSYKFYYSKSASGDYLPVKENGNDVVIDGSSESYTVKGLSQSSTYYFKMRAFYDESLSSSSSILGPYAQGTTKGNSAEPKITKPPMDLYKNIEEKPEFSIEAEPSKVGNTLSYKWQQLVQSEYLAEWKDIPSDEANKPTFNAAYSSSDGLINETNAKTLDKTVYRCIVTEISKDGNNYCSVTSRSAVLHIGADEKHIYDKNGFCINCGAYQPAVLNSDGVYEISNAGNLFWFSSLVRDDKTKADFEKSDTSAKAILTADIDLQNREWLPIGNKNGKSYSGIFDGGNKSIKNINGMLFGSVNNGTLKNIHIDSGTFSGNSNYSSHTGSILGEMLGGSITHSYSKANSKDVVGDLGGLAGKVCGTITDCYFAGTLNGTGTTGGIAGSSWNAGYPLNIKDCFVSANSISGNSNTGAFVGWLHGDSTVDNSYYNSTAYKGNPFGTSQNGRYTNEAVKALSSKSSDVFKSGEVTYLLNSETTDGTQLWYQNIDNGVTPDDYPKFDGGTVYKNTNCAGVSSYSNNKLENISEHQFDENGFCKVCGEYQPAVLNSDSVYEISNAGQLYWFASLVNGDKTHADFDSQNGAASAVLVNDIVVNNGDVNKLADTQPDSLRKWTPIGNYDNSYTGCFDGQHHTISGLYFSDSNINDVGLFGYTRGGADVYNVGVINSYFKGKNDVGAIIGRNNNSGVTIQRCFSEATVVGNEGVGGIEGSTYGGKIVDCYNAGSVTGSKYVASIRGINTYNTTSSGAIVNCFNVGRVTGTGSSNIGGIRGDGNGTISNCYCISSQLTDSAATTKTPEQFASGEVAYLLNNSVTDGKQIWYQNIDNDATPDDYPKFDGGTVYYLDYKDTYSNTYSEAPKEPGEFDKDEDGNLVIKTYDDLVKLSQLIRSDYDTYGSQNYILVNNIKAPDGSKWTQGIGSAADNKPFNGTFYGDGYCIIGLNVNSSEYGGLFEIIGEKGCVKDLLVFDCTFTSSSKTSGGIAAVNNGTIDHCISGINPATGTIHFGNTTINVSDLNSNIKGEISGGIVGENNGLITGCRNASVITGTQCGGIAGLNTGKIYGCANNSAVGTSASKVSGGLAGKNGGTIESSYNSAVINGSSESVKGSIAGINGYEGSENPKVTNVFYRTANGLNAVGTDSSVIPDSTNTGMSSISDFQNDSFTDKLNSVSDDTINWVRHSVLNRSYPVIEGNFLKMSVKSAGNNILVKGSMHSSLNIDYTACDKNDSLYKLLSDGIGENNILKSYSLSMTDNDGNYIPAELWCQGNFEISVPVNSENVKFAGIDEEGNIVYCEPDSVKNGVAVFTVSHPMSFAVVETANNTHNGGDTEITTPATKSDDSTPVQTGSATNSSVLLIAMFSLVLIIALRRRNKIG